MSFQAKSDAVRGQQLKVQRLVIPFSITANATAASKTLTSGAPNILFLQTEGLDHVSEATGALASGETESFTQTADDSDGKFNMLVKIGETVTSILGATVNLVATGVNQPTFKNTSGDSLSSTDTSILLNCDSTVDLSSGTTVHDFVLAVEYTVAD